MRKLLGLAAIVLVLLALAAPALAQDSARDPFVPLIQPTPVATGTDPTAPVDPAVPVDSGPAPTDPLPSTGAPATTWVGLGYVLIALGAGAVAVSKLFGPLRVPAR